MKLAHTANNGLAGFGIELDREGRVFFCQLLDGNAHLFLVGLRLGLNGHVDHGLREGHGLEDDRLVDRAKRIASGRILQADNRVDVACMCLFDRVFLVGVHLEDLADALLLALGRVKNLRACLQLARVNTDEGQLAVEGVSCDLKCERCEGFLLRGLADLVALFVVMTGLEAANRGDIQRRGQVVDDRVEHGLNAHVTKCGTAEDGECATGDGQCTHAFLDLLNGQLAVFEVGLGQLIGAFRSCLDEGLAVLFRLLLEFCGDLAADDKRTKGGLAVLVFGGVTHRFHGQQIDGSLEVILRADGQVHDDRGCVKAIANGLNREVEVRTHLVHLVDEADTGDVILVSLTPHGLRLGLDTFLTVEHGDCTVEDAQRALNLNREVNVTGGVDDVDLVSVPEGGDGCGGDGNTTLLFLLHPVGGGGAIMRLTNLVVNARVEQDSFGHGGLAGIDVSHDADVANLLEVSKHLVCHYISPSFEVRVLKHPARSG